jgi:hypothetical protein
MYQCARSLLFCSAAQPWYPPPQLLMFFSLTSLSLTGLNVNPISAGKVCVLDGEKRSGRTFRCNTSPAPVQGKSTVTNAAHHCALATAHASHHALTRRHVLYW